MKYCKLFDGVYLLDDKLATINLTPKEKVYGEELVEYKGLEYRIWNPFRSKLGAAIKKGLKKLKIKSGDNIFYLGCAEGTTPSHISDIIGEKGLLLGLDVSARSMRRFVFLCEQRKNMLPILADANKPKEYEDYFKDLKIDVLFQDIAQKNQAEIFLKNSIYLKKCGVGLLSIKAKSISSSSDVKKIFETETKKIEDVFDVKEIIPLAPFEKDHVLVSCIKKS